MGVPLLIDYTSLFGGEVETLPRQELMSRWQSVLSGFDATQHLIANTLVKFDGSEAEAIAYVRATHHLGDRASRLR